MQLFRENCLHEKTADRLKRAESMAAAWLVLDTLFDDPLQFTKDLMGDILAYAKMKDYEYEKLFDYYSMVQYTIDEADKANRGNMFLIAYNIDEMTRPLPPRELFRLKLEVKFAVVVVNLGVKKERAVHELVPIVHLYGKVVV